MTRGKKYLFGAFSVLVLACLCVFLYPVLVHHNKKSINAILRKYHYTPLTPPSTLVPPGSLVTIESDDPFVIGLICNAAAALGADLEKKLSVSASASTSEVEELTGNFSLDAEDEKQATAKVKSGYVQSISVDLSKVSLLELPDSVVFELISKRDQHCVEAIKFRQLHNQKFSMIKSVMRANVTYKVEFSGNLDFATRAAATADIAANLGMSQGVKGNNTIEGEGLYWGVRDDTMLAKVSAIAPPSTGARKSVPILPERAAKVVNSENSR